ncbi:MULTISPECIES: hypothetical protein [unclassified Mesorhizobium]|uniref:hypothetical protein n=1 Tax=unclassified Mesorhizobium TaxID=325217 RepID=UPI000FC9B134|nr:MULTISPECIES: hypothetical protein [unclassified Mesorhizobium]RVD69973.1 hypothetical protein EN751_23190 [Mesorhizobium sp. M4A.F.Ca.ET.029.04.2.1]RUW71018.1 hypothetical protein EOA31_18870 [Mesorhizobium sp. M4B.F.Ca.ET.049.02.1.2]TGV26434.1 hypothetical protein EN786_13045 [Mesorhizobium sp. M4B.F.Ca.ET.143.01.1.1]TIW27096.1 MAG: hypothetical protein E5V63_10915 [Mesorhizobium sp.]TIW36524.1 MAG: hypothetical protein E5V62_06090 [Mesorhizobium sp.]
MRPREQGTFVPGADPKVLLDHGERLKVAGACQWFDEGQRVSFWIVTDFTGTVIKKVAHSLELAVS